jgi:hypothetical protein
MGNNLEISYFSKGSPVQFKLMDLNGKELCQESRTDSNSFVEFQLETGSLRAACYLLEVQTTGGSLVKKVIIY